MFSQLPIVAKISGIAAVGVRFHVHQKDHIRRVFASNFMHQSIKLACLDCLHKSCLLCSSVDMLLIFFLVVY